MKAVKAHVELNCVTPAALWHRPESETVTVRMVESKVWKMIDLFV